MLACVVVCLCVLVSLVRFIPQAAARYLGNIRRHVNPVRGAVTYL